MTHIASPEPDCKAPCTPAPDPSDIPPGFSVSAYPILACHWFGAPPFVLDENGETEPVKSRRLG